MRGVDHIKKIFLMIVMLFKNKSKMNLGWSSYHVGQLGLNQIFESWSLVLSSIKESFMCIKIFPH